jgi:glycosyltransferase involved in cell wall biosynthesis
MPLKLLLVHNYYQQRGGEDVVFEAEARLLEEHGHQVVRYEARNDGLDAMPSWTLARQSLWNSRTHRDVRRLLERERPALVHVHNTLPVISPSVYYAARGAGVPLVQTLHNYRLLCPSAVLFRAGAVCEACLHLPLAHPAVRYGCYRGSRAASAVVATTSVLQRLFGTWTRCVDLFVALTKFARGKFIEGGLAGDRIMVKPNFAPDPMVERWDGDYALFVGRLSPEKGVRPLLDAWRRLGGRIRLRIIGDGPESRAVTEAVEAGVAIDYLGRQSPEAVAAAMAGAKFLVFPSVWYETFGLTIIEAYAAGLPVLASDLGAMTDLVKDGVTGLRFRPGDPEHLARVVEWALEHPGDLRAMGRNARREYESRYTPERNLAMLLEVYEAALRRRAEPTGRRASGAWTAGTTVDDRQPVES